MAAIGRGLAGLLKGIFRGVKKLKTPHILVGFFLSGAGTLSADYCLETFFTGMEAPVYVKHMLYYGLLFLPAIYLLLVGLIQDARQARFLRVFKEIDFKGRDKKYPYFLELKEENKKQIYTFYSNISLPEWRKVKERLETGLDCNILLIENGANKKTVKLVTLPSDYKIPTLLKWSDGYLSGESGVITVGQGALENISFDLNRVPHVLVAGETGSGKSVILRTCLWQMINQGARVYMIDFKGGVEFGKRYERYGEVITERERALAVLADLVEENKRRLALFRDLEVKNLVEYNRKTGENLCRIGVFSDEIAEMLDKKGVPKEEKAVYEMLEGQLSTLARLSRATGINLFLGVQRPDANVLTGQIKNNVPVRISGRFADKSASEIVLGNTAAVELPDIKGRFLYKVGNETVEFQAFYFDDDTMLKEVEVEQGDMLTAIRGMTEESGEKGRGKTGGRGVQRKPDIEEKPLDLDFDFVVDWGVPKK